MTKEKCLNHVRKWKVYRLWKLLDSVNKENYYLLKDNHEAIITEEVFNKVQEEKSSRSNLDEDNVRKSRKHSSRLKEDNKKV